MRVDLMFCSTSSSVSPDASAVVSAVFYDLHMGFDVSLQLGIVW